MLCLCLPSFTKESLAVMCLHRREVVTTGMGTDVVILFNRTAYCHPGFIDGRERFIQKEFYFQNSIDSFGNSVLIGVSFFSHRDFNLIVLKHLYILGTAIL